MTSVEIHPIRFAIMLCRYGQTRNTHAATYFIILSSTAASSATSGYVVVPEHFGQNGEPVGSKKERTKKA